MNKQVINLYINKEKDLYCSFNDDNELDDKIINYLVNKCAQKNIEKGIKLNIVSKEKVNEIRVQNAFDKWIELSNKQLKNQYWKNISKQIWMFVIGFVFIVLSILLQSKVNTVIYTLLSTIGAFSIWEVAAIWIIENPSIRLQKRNINMWKKGLEIIFQNNEKIES